MQVDDDGDDDDVKEEEEEEWTPCFMPLSLGQSARRLQRRQQQGRAKCPAGSRRARPTCLAQFPTPTVLATRTLARAPRQPGPGAGPTPQGAGPGAEGTPCD